MKPVAAGVVRVGQAWASEDALALRAASTIAVPPQLDNPVLLPDPVSPHLAAQRAGVRIDIGHIVRCYRRLAEPHDRGHCKIGRRTGEVGQRGDTGGDLAKALALPVVLVVGLRLGCLNHALLTAEAIAARGLLIAGWVANQIDPEMSRFAENLATLDQLLLAPRLGMVAYDPEGGPKAAANSLQLPE